MTTIYYKVVAGVEWVRWSHNKDWLDNRPGLCGHTYLSNLKKTKKEYKMNDVELKEV